MNKGQFLTFTIADTLYAVSVFCVQAVLPYTEPQKLPCPDPLIAGIIRSRNTNISVLKLREKFDQEPKEPDFNTHIIVFEAHNAESGEVTLFGGIVDNVEEVVVLEEAQTEPPPEMGRSIAERFVSGVGMKDDRFVIILNPDTIFSFEEMENMKNCVHNIDNEDIENID